MENIKRLGRVAGAVALSLNLLACKPSPEQPRVSPLPTLQAENTHPFSGPKVEIPPLPTYLAQIRDQFKRTTSLLGQSRRIIVSVLSCDDPQKPFTAEANPKGNIVRTSPRTDLDGTDMDNRVPRKEWVQGREVLKYCQMVFVRTPGSFLEVIYVLNPSTPSRNIGDSESKRWIAFRTEAGIHVKLVNPELSEFDPKKEEVVLDTSFGPELPQPQVEIVRSKI